RADGSSAGDLASARLENPRAISPTQSGGRTPPCSVKWRRKSLVINESHPQSVELGLTARRCFARRVNRTPFAQGLLEERLSRLTDSIGQPHLRPPLQARFQ